MQTIPIQPVPSQLSKVVLGDQNCQIALSQKERGLFVDVNVNGVDIVVGIIARDAVPIVCREYAGFQGNLLFIDTRGSDDPVYTDLGTRFQLLYLTAEEYELV